MAPNSEVLGSTGPDVVYTVPQTAQRPRVGSAVYSTVHYKEPLTLREDTLCYIKILDMLTQRVLIIKKIYRKEYRRH